ncbi:16S rRNA (cytidine(1402)-2'-O)-methyltransferase [Thiohalophilus sp.]|uniref:16S rRNA (cytidine(1402)-2'-O)-methyltransferase n=1 Tax=Thiohalophilus sp. TaxID=3028392 RepID=UPI002ACDD630|nr:16S rRNA (cytidine(1402)-2'-O)-methyltransferase [Thiohalophilus sp.]MDZ7803196.1 16S rRNA (cytidine(1402)-2'-O)-methyltransferase [Thiohalophilus sp.]
MNSENSALYVVATPIGNLGDMSQRAVEILQQVALIAAEDTRHSARLLRHFAVTTPCVALHEHNEREQSSRLLQRLANGESVALIADAGTPLLSDPGFHLVQQARLQGIRVIPVPGPSAVVAALSVSGLPTDCFKFIGFLPAKSAARRQRLAALVAEPCTLAFYESPHRILESLADMGEVLGRDRDAVLARELTKTFETVQGGSLDELHAFVSRDANQQKGEMVLLVAGAPAVEAALNPEVERILGVLLEELPVKQAAALAARITGVKKNQLYQQALVMKN